MDNKKLFVGNLPWSLSSDDLRKLFEQYGEITDAVVITDKMTGRSKGFGFVTFAEEAAAQEAKDKMNEYELEGRKIVVNVAKPKQA